MKTMQILLCISCLMLLANICTAQAQERWNDTSGPVFREPILAKEEPPSSWRFGVGWLGRFLEGDYGSDETLRTFQNNFILSTGYGIVDFSASFSYLITDTIDLDSNDVEQESGFGDIYLGLGVLALRQENNFLNVYLSGGLKIPTADENKSLGTGNTDVYFYLTLSRWFDNWLALVRGGYVFVGGSEYENSWAGEIAFGRRFMLGKKANLQALLWGRGQTSVLEDSDDPFELAFTLDFTPDGSLFFNLETAVGVTDSSPDYTIGLGIGYQF